MESIWCKPELSDEIIKNEAIFNQTQSIIADIMSKRVDIIHIIVENLRGVLTSKEIEHRVKGMQFFTKILTEIPKDYLESIQVNFIAKFYIDRLKDNHKVIPYVLEGYLAMVDMKNYEISNCGEFFTIFFREVSCQMLVRKERYHFYLLLQKLIDRNLEYMKTLGIDFVYGVIQAIDGERDPRNLLFLFSILPKFIKNMPLQHLTDEMFSIISCYYPVDFHPAPDDPAPVTRQDLSNALKPCLCAIPQFGEQCLILLVEKLDSNLRVAKLDSLDLLTESCKTFYADTYSPFLKVIWSSIYREITHKTDEELKMAAHNALSALVKKLSETANTDKVFENFVMGILLAMQTSIAESTTVAQFVQATRVLLNAANASKESCLIITKSMISATIAFYGFKTSPKLQIASLDFLGDLFEMAQHWEIVELIEPQLKHIPQHCLIAISQPVKDFQMAGFKTLIRSVRMLETELVLPFVEVLMHNIQHSQDNDLLAVSIETIHAIARKYPELIMSLVVKGKCDLENLTSDDVGLQKRLNLLSNLASIDDFTKIIIEEMLKLISNNDKEAIKVVQALSESISNSKLCSEEKIIQIESDHGLIDSVLAWIQNEVTLATPDSLAHSSQLISNTMLSLPAIKQLNILDKYTRSLLEKCKENDVYFLTLHSLHTAVRQTVYDKYIEEVMHLSLNLSLNSNNEVVRTKACALVAHFINKAAYGQKFESLYENLKDYFLSCDRDKIEMCLRLIILYGWIVKALAMRGSDLFSFWLQKVAMTLTNEHYCQQGCQAIGLIVTDFPDYLTPKQHCRVSILYKQRVFQVYASLTQKFDKLPDSVMESYLLSWALIFDKTPKNVLNNESAMVIPLAKDGLNYDNALLLMVMIDVLCHFALSEHPLVSESFQTILPRLVTLSQYVKSMDVRIKSLQCLYDIANSYSTVLLLPYKQDVLYDLAPSLDDKKRLVRNIAVKARTRWFMIGAPGENKEK